LPLHLLERVVMRSSVAIDSSILARLADAGVGVLIFGGRNATKQAIVLDRVGNDGARRVGQ
jgi:CRISPR-associated protein Cas1